MQRCGKNITAALLDQAQSPSSSASCFTQWATRYPQEAHRQELFLDDAKVKNFITCFKDKQFLAFFFKQLKLNQSGRYQDSFPYLSPCGREHNYLRCDDRPIVFTHLLQGAAGEEVLSYCGGAERLVVPFQPEKLVMLPENGRVYHPGPAKAGGVGLVKSALAFELSPCFEYELGPTHPPTHFCWRDKRHTLTNELLQCIQDKDEGA
ncbi:UPF0598 protein C8orf82 homolog isoform X3 [Hemicordylus capensis]|uniref:UPF0598 protein C8orf82 homolog isoform X3 n=1 Tax=Hemicordylus capensis TaxID=884348 RepID=UPI002304A020|nr:UPF0598 protein C8orf82 homolog isoform X3 [Hemicordylus capensis]